MKSKWNLLSWVNKQLKIKGDSSNTGGTGGNGHSKGEKAHDNKPPENTTPINDQSELEAHARKVIVVSTIEVWSALLLSLLVLFL